MKHFYQRLLISAFLLICAILANAEVIDGIAYTLNGNTKTASVKKRDGNYSGDIVIPETITVEDVVYSVTSIGEWAFFYYSELTSITIPNSVTSIGENAFYECSGLTSVNIPNSVTSIGKYTFKGCRYLTSIIVERDNPAYDSREDCNGIIETQTNTLVAGCKSTIIPNSVTSIGDRAFVGCTGLTSVTIPKSVTSIGEGAF